MPEETTLTEADLTWAARVWGQLTVNQCEAVIHMALRWPLQPATPEHSYLNYLRSMSELGWPNLGRPLQCDVCRALRKLQTLLS